MIWFKEELRCREQPEKSTITLAGIYNTPGATPSIPTIIIRLSVEEDKESHNMTMMLRTLFEKSLTMLQQEDPTSEEILVKYQAKILKFKEKIQNATYAEIFTWNDPS